MFFEDILTNLNNQIEYFASVNELCRKEKQAIIDGDVDTVSEIVEQLRDYFKKTRNEEEARVEIIKNSKEFSGKEDVALDDIINICTDAQMKEKLIDAKMRLIEVIKEQKGLDEIISELLKSNLEYCEYMITAFSNEVTPNNLYARDGREIGSDRAAVSILDSEV